jgi:eukaryotic-like serine/threonine-protein kinase
MSVATRSNLFRYKSTPGDPLAARAFFQGRVRGYLGYALAIWGMALLGDRVVAITTLGDPFAAPSALYLEAHYSAIVSIGVLYLVTRRRVLGSAALRAIEVGATLVQAGCSATLLGQIPAAARPEFLALFAATLFLILRAGLVPGGVGLALGVGLISMAPSHALMQLLYSKHPELLAGTSGLQAQSFYLLEWSAMALAATTAIHSVIYGLEERVQELGQYTLLHKIGEGGMGVVYRARHALLRRPTAVKLLPLQRTSANGVARFEREVQLTAELAHPNIVSVYDFGKSSDGSFYYAMEYLDGVDLQRLVEAHGPVDERRVLHLLRQAADALAEAHQIGLVHRDIKPANLFLSNPPRRPDHLTMLDFGLATQFSGDPAQTSATELRGTPLYMAPEAIRDAAGAGDRSDVYALGAVAYFLLTGTPPFTGATVVEVCAAHLHTEPEPPAQRLGRPVFLELEALVLDCLSKAPEARPEGAAGLLARLERLALPAWTVEDARAWWNEHGAGLRAEARPSEGPRTFAINRAAR